jgi:hypothetical protein
VLVLLLAGCGGEQRADLTTNAPISEVAAGSEPSSSVERKIIYTATIDLAVRELAKTQQELNALIESAGGYAATFREEKFGVGQPGCRWIVRLPAANCQRFTAQVIELGVVLTQQTDAQDVTEQYIDLNARLRNKQRMEQRVLKLLEERKGEIREVLDMESQLARIREEIESLEGKVRYLADRVAMTTVTITARQDANYFPAAPPSFAGKAASTLAESLASLQQLAEGLALAVIAVLPWLLGGLVVFGLPAVVCLFWRRLRISLVEGRT